MNFGTFFTSKKSIRQLRRHFYQLGRHFCQLAQNKSDLIIIFAERKNDVLKCA
jgi:hypothetical protein